MAVATDIDRSYFVLDVPDVGWGGAPMARMFEFSVSPAGGSPQTFTEPCAYSADGGVVFRGLSKLLESYVGALPLSKTLFSASGCSYHGLRRASFSVTLHFGPVETHLTSILSSVAYYAGRRMSSSPAGCRMWLSRYHRRTVSPVHPLVASSFVFYGIGVRLRVYWTSSGTGRLTALTTALSSDVSDPSAAPLSAMVLCYSLADLAAAVNAEEGGSACDASCIHVVYADLLSSGNLLDTLEFDIDHGHRKLEKLVAFTNCWGMPEVESFTGSDERTTTLDGEYAWMDDLYVKTFNQEVTSHRLCAVGLSEAQRSSLLDLASSPEVYLLRDGDTSLWERETVQNIELSDRRPRTQPQTAFVTLRSSERHQEAVSRSVTPVAGGVFDETFDPSFN